MSFTIHRNIVDTNFSIDHVKNSKFAIMLRNSFWSILQFLKFLKSLYTHDEAN